MAEIALKKLEESFKGKISFRPTLNKQQIAEILKSLNSETQKLKYSYLEENDLADSDITKEIVSLATQLFDAIEEGYYGSDKIKSSSASLNESMIRWGIKLLMGLSNRFREASRPTIEAGIDMEVVGIRNIIPIPDSNLYLSRVYNGKDDFTVVTNLQNLKPGMHMGVAYLPPVIIGGKVSEAMYIGDTEYDESIPFGTTIFEKANFGEVRNLLKQEYLKKGK